MPELTNDENKLAMLARGARARASAREAAAVMDDMGRSYAAASIDLSSLRLTAVQAAVAAAISSGTTKLDIAVAVSTSADLAAEDRAVLEELGAGRIIVVGLDEAPARSPR